MASLPQSLVYETYSPQLADCGYNLYSQYGEDGILERLFDLIGTRNEWCFEIGAADGVFYSNTLKLRQAGWSAVLIESSEDMYAKLQWFESETVHTVHAHATNLDPILSRFNVPTELDLGVIDIDGQDYWLWHDLTEHRPRVLMIEFHWADGENFIPQRGFAGRCQAGINAIQDLSETKGYTLAARTHVNLIYVRNEDTQWQ